MKNKNNNKKKLKFINNFQNMKTILTVFSRLNNQMKFILQYGYVQINQKKIPLKEF